MQIFDPNNETRKMLLPAIHEALTSTCQLFHYTNTRKSHPTPNGCCILIQHNDQYYAFSCAHVIADAQLGKTYALTKDGTAVNLAGQTFHTRMPKSNKRCDDSLDIAVVKLSPEATEMLSGSGFNFINTQRVKTGVKLEPKQQLLLAGFPASKTNLDKTNNRLKFQPYIARTVPVIQKKEIKNYPSIFHHFVSFPDKSFVETSTKERQIAPKLDGMSGSGIWMMATSDYITFFPLLIGIFSEFDKNKSLIISTKVDLFMSLASQLFDPSIPNEGVEIEILR